VAFELKPILQQPLKHRAKLAHGRIALGLRGHVVSIGFDPVRCAGDLKLHHVVGVLNEQAYRTIKNNC